MSSQNWKYSKKPRPLDWWYALLDGADGFLPMVDVIDAVAVDETAAREAHELRLEVCDDLRKVGAEAIGAVVKGFLRKKGNHVEGDLARPPGEHDETGSGVRDRGRENGGCFFPIGRGCGQTRFGEKRSGFALEADGERCGGAGKLPDEEGDVIALPRLHRNAAEAFVLQAHSPSRLFDGEHGVTAVDCVERLGAFDRDRALRAVALDELPGGERSPASMVGVGIVE